MYYIFYLEQFVKFVIEVEVRHIVNLKIETINELHKLFYMPFNVLHSDT